LHELTLFFFQAEDGIRDRNVTGVQTCALPISASVLCSKSGLPLSTFKRARAELCEKGYILHRSRGTKAPVYQMVSLVERQSGEFLDGDVLAEEGKAEREVPESGRENEESRREVDKA